MKSVPGLTLVEVVLAVLILGVGVTSLMGLQGTLMRGVFSAHAVLDRIGFIRSFFVTAEKNRLWKRAVQTKELEDPVTTLSYSQRKPVSSGIATQQYLVVEQIDAEWPSIMGTRKDSFARLVFKPQKEVS